MKNLLFKGTAVVLISAVTGLLILLTGQAHPRLSAATTSPAPNEVLTASPGEIRVGFSVSSTEGGLVDALSRFWVVRDSGDVVVADGGADLEDADRASMIATLEEDLEPGRYIVFWVGVSTAENGFTQGDYRFTIEAAE